MISATPRVVTAAHLQLDLSRMQLPDNLDRRLGSLLDGAFEQMEAVERGEIVNIDEGRQVGHYWLRDAALAPAEYRGEVQGMLDAIQGFNAAANFDRVLWIGIGGSALGPQMLRDALQQPGTSPPMVFFDNTDPEGFEQVLQQIQHAGGLERTLAVVVSKSGGTKETRNGMLVAQDAYAAAGGFESRAVAITGPDSALDRLASGADGGPAWLARFPLWDWVGGRTSLFSAVGILTAQLIGASVDDLRAGARAVDQATRQRSLQQNAALLLAATWYQAVEVEGRGNMVVLPYSDRLSTLASYMQQLVMESVGKSGKGITVLGNKGSTDQHSYVQQLRDGRDDFFATFVRSLVPDRDWEVEPGVTAGDYLAAFQEGTARALSEAGRPSLRITVERINAEAVGGLVALFERAVGYYAAMLGINAYHQPGVEAGKKAADQVLQVQRAVVEQLEARPKATAAEIAAHLHADVHLVADLIHRLQRCGRLAEG